MAADGYGFAIDPNGGYYIRYSTTHEGRYACCWGFDYSVDNKTIKDLLNNTDVTFYKDGYNLIGFSSISDSQKPEYTLSTNINNVNEVDYWYMSQESLLNPLYCIWQKIPDPVTMLVQDTSLIEIADAIRSKIPLVVTDKSKLLFMGLATTDMFSIGDQITVPWSDGSTTYDFVWDVAHITTAELEDGTTTSGMYLQAHYCLPFNTPFDGAESGNSDSNVNSYGSNRWKTSNLRRYLNGKGSSWFTKQTSSDVLSSSYSGVQGFMSGFEDDFLNILKPVKVSTQCNTVNDGGGTDITYDTFFSPSLEQHYINPTSTYNVTRGVEGEAWDYWKKVANNTEHSYGNTVSSFITYAINAKSSACYVWLRSAYRSNSYGVAYVGDSGYVNGNLAYRGFRVAPCCFIPLSDSSSS